MAHVSEPGFLVLHGLRLKGFAAPEVLAGVVEMPDGDVQGALATLQESGLVQYREGRITGWSLTASGRAEHAERCCGEVTAVGCREVVEAAYRSFLEVNEPFLAVCTDWQLRTAADGSQAMNDHSDSSYDAAVVKRLRELHVAVDPICTQLTGVLARFAPYGPRLAEALAKVEAGEGEWFTGALIESYHTVWFELHEDLLATLGIGREAEADAMTAGRFGSVLTAMVTPFDEAGAVDLDGTVRLARWLVDHGNDGLVITGTTGESPTLTDEEKISVWRAVTEAVTVPVIVGAGSNDTAHTVELTKAASQTGAAGVLIVTPYYNRPSQAGLDGHFRAAAAATNLPVMLYDIPVRSGRKIAHDTLIRLIAEVPNIVAVKDAANDLPGSARLVAEAASGFELYSGNDDVTLPLLAIGAVGLVGVATHWAGELCAEMVAAFAKGDVETARQINARLLPSFAFESTDDAPNPLPAKAVLRLLGQPGGGCRPPMDGEPPSLEGRARAVLAGLGIDLPDA